MKNFLLFALGAFLFASCAKDESNIIIKHYPDEDFAIIQANLNLPANPLDYTPNLPPHLAPFSATAAGTINDDMATLGRVIFYDKKISKDGSISCASCHEQTLGFADDRAVSEGVEDNETDRNSLALGAFVSFRQYYNTVIGGGSRAGFFWDEGVPLLEDQAKATIENKKEMGMDLDELVVRLRDIDYYQALFRTAFRSDNAITEDNIAFAVSEFVNSIISAEAPFDLAHPNSTSPTQLQADWAQFSAAENRGKSLFINNCSSCHGFTLSPGFAFMSAVAQTVANNGLDLDYEDKGVGERSGLQSDNGKFKIPLLRNVEVTGPYIHDGRFETLEEVVDFYSEGIQNHPNLDANLRDDNGQPKKMNFSNEDKADLIAFLNTLSDPQMMSAERFTDPFPQ